MPPVRYQQLAPLSSAEGSRCVLGLALEPGAAPRPVALVWAPAELPQDESLVARLERETQRALVLEHPNILRVHGLVALEGGLARVTEYADGETLRQVLERCQRLPPGLAALVLAEVAMGVHYAHLAGHDDGTPLVHGDLRPETLMVCFSGLCQVTGYGALGVAPREPHGRRVPNRRRYSAPEQLLGGREAVNVQTDVFLLGLVLYECLTGRIPFKDTPNPDRATLGRPLPPLPLGLPPALDSVLHKATAKRASERYPSALAFREALVQAVGVLPSRQSLSDYLSRFFPPEGEVRRARQQLLEAAVAEAVRAERAPQARPSLELPAVSGSSAPAPEPAARVEAAAPRAPAPAPFALEEEDDEDEPDRSRSLMPLAAAGLVLIIAGGALLQHNIRESHAPARTSEPSAPARTSEPPASAPPLADTGLQAGEPAPTEAGESTRTQAAAAPGERPAAPAAPPAGRRPAGAEALLELRVEPAVAVSLNGRALGGTPLDVRLPPGRHVLMLSNPALGIRTARAVTLSATERNLHELRLLKGFIAVKAPAGSLVTVDGREVGPAPIEQLDLYEGPHHLRVTRNGQSWEQAFQLEPQRHVVFKVDFDEP